jgi:hypothetical protein
MDWNDYGPTIEDSTILNDELSKAEKRLLIRRSNIEFYRAALPLVLTFIIVGIIAALLKGWLALVVGGGFFLTVTVIYTWIESEHNRVSIALQDEYERQKQTPPAKKRAKK